MNQITLLGRLTADIDLTLANQTSYARFVLAVDRDRSEAVDFVQCVAFRKLAEALAHNCHKGRQLLVTGHLQISRKNGKSYYSVISDKIEFLQKPKAKAKEAEEAPF